LKKWVKRNRALATSAALALLCLIAGLATVAIVQTAAKREVTTAFEKEQLANRQSQENLADAYVSNGLREASDGQFARAQLWFTQAADVAAHDSHRALANRLRAKNFGQAAAIPIRVISDLPRIHYNAIIPHPELPFAILDDWSDQRWLLLDFENERWVNFEGGKAKARYPAAAFEPGSDRIAISREDGKVEFRSLIDLTLVKLIDLGADAGQVNALAFSPNGNLLFIGTQDARVWDRDADQLRAETLPHPAPTGWAKFSGNGANLLTSTRDPNDENVNAVRAFSIGEKIAPAFEGTRIHRTHGSQKARPAFVDPNGATFLTQEEHWQASIWETATGEKKQSFPAEPSRGVSPDGRLLLSGREIRDLQTGTVTPLGSHGYGRLSPDASTFALEAPRHFYSVGDGERRGPLPPQVTAFPFEFAAWQDSTCLITARNTTHSTVVTLWRLPTESHAWELPVNGPFSKVSSSPDGQHIATAGNSVYLTARAHDQPITTTRVYDLASRQPASDEIVPGAPILDTQFSPDGNTLAIALGAPADPDWDKKRHLPLPPRPGRIEFWDWKQSQRTGDPITLASEAHCLAFHPDGWLAILCVDGSVMRLDHGSTSPTKLFQIDRGEGIAAKLLTGHTRLAFSDDAKILIAGPLWNPGTVYAWDLQQDSLRFTAPSTYAFTVSGDVLATTNPSNSIRISDGTPIKTPNNPGNYEFSLNADGTRLLAGGMVNSAQLWDLRSGQQLGRDLSGGNRHSGAFIEGTPWVATAASGRIEHPGAAVRLWDPQSGTLIAPELRFETSKSGNLQMFAATGFGALTGSQAICLDLRSLKTADWPHGSNFPPTDLKQLAELHAREVIEDGQVRELTPEAWLASWKEFRQKHPEFHQIGK
jgi:WD40 repeat protein